MDSSKPSGVKKRSSPKKQKTKLVAGSSGSRKTLRNMVDELEANNNALSSDSSISSDPAIEGTQEGMEHSSFNEVEEKVFHIMQLPAEIRLDIYRACLTRPTKILLSKKPRGPVDEAMVSEASQQSTGRLTTQGTTSLPENGSSTPLPLQTYTPRSSRKRRRIVSDSAPEPTQPEADPNALVINLLRVSKQVYKEARDVLYSENIFDIDIKTAVASLAALHQRSRSLIRHVELEIASHSEILERFSEVVRLSLRYCTGLGTLVIHMPFTLPGAHSGACDSVYANGFDILRWLPQNCKVVLEGCENENVKTVVRKHLALAKNQDKLAYARRQIIAGDTVAV